MIPFLQVHLSSRATPRSATDRGLRISWGGIVAGTVLGWAVFSLLSLLGAAIGLAKFDPYSTNPANGLGAGSAFFGVIALLVSSFLGAYLAVRIAGDRRRSEALAARRHLLGLLADDRRDARAGRCAYGCAERCGRRLRIRAQARAERETNARRNSGATQADRERAAEATDAAGEDHGRRSRRRIPRAGRSLIGSLAAARRRSHKDVSDGMQKRKRDDLHQPPSRPAQHDENDHRTARGVVTQARPMTAPILAEDRRRFASRECDEIPRSKGQCAGRLRRAIKASALFGERATMQEEFMRSSDGFRMIAALVLPLAACATGKAAA